MNQHAHVGDGSPLKKALLAIATLEHRVATLQSAAKEPIAIIGMSCRLPGGADEPQEFFRLLMSGFDAIGDLPADRWNATNYGSGSPSSLGDAALSRGGYLENIDEFEPYFFGISPREATELDPQQRLLLELSWHAIEDAGLPVERVSQRRVGVFVGIQSSDFMLRQLSRLSDLDAYSSTGMAHCTALGRIAYFFDLHGPTVAIDAACASSLLALHQAVASLRSGECEMALAGGVNAILHPMNTLLMSRLGALARDGVCRTFDAKANGYVRGEGGGMLLLKPLSRARADGDVVRAIIRGSATSQDGRSNGLTAPNGLAQADCIQRALADSHVPPACIGLVETHGTATELGDPIEVEALKSVYGRPRTNGLPLVLGALKTNIGHLEPAAGVAGVIKAVLALEAAMIPPNRNFASLNPHIDLGDSPLAIPTRPLAWPAVKREGNRDAGTEGRYAAVSAIGVNGCNVHVVLEDEPTRERPRSAGESGSGPWVLPISARSAEDLELNALAYRDYLAGTPHDFRDICHSAARHRTHHQERLAIVASSSREALEALKAVSGAEEFSAPLRGRASTQRPRRIFVFSGQGPAFWPLAPAFIRETVVRETLEECDQLLRELGHPSLLAQLQSPERFHELQETGNIQPALVSVQIALTRLWAQRGVQADELIGHSLGEVAAAHAASAVSLRDAMLIAHHRGRLFQSLRGKGQMLFVALSGADAASATRKHGERLSIAAYNSPCSSVLSGDADTVNEAQREFEREGIFCRLLGSVDFASHCAQVDAIVPDLLHSLANLARVTPKLPWRSTTYARLVTATDGGARYWADNARNAVQFHDTIKETLANGPCVFIEVGPHPVLSTAIEQICKESAPRTRVLWSQHREQSLAATMASSLANLYTVGAAIDWTRAGPADASYVRVPLYRWKRARYWPNERVASEHPERVDADEVWRSLVRVGHLQSQSVPIDLHVEGYARKWELLDRFTEHCMLRTLTRFTEGQPFSVDLLIGADLVLARHARLLSRWIARLMQSGAVVCERGMYRVATTVGEEEAVLLARLREAFNDSEPYLRSILLLANALEAILAGTMDPLEVLFPSGSLDLSTYINRDWPPARYFNSILRALVASIATACPPSHELKVLEVGAGTGSTTSTVLPVLQPRRARYTHTDVSDFFASKLRGEFAAFSQLDFGTFDLNESPDSQGYARHDFDVVVAANSLHTARDVGVALRNVRSLLAPGGILLVYEFTRPLAFFDITTGLLPGWQSFADAERLDVPLLELRAWETQLRDNGFDRVASFPEEGSVLDVLGQHVLVARAQTNQDSCFGRREPTSSDAARDVATAQAMPVPAPQFSLHTSGNREALARRWVVEKLATILRMPKARVRTDVSLQELGLDSLMAVELKAAIKLEQAVELPLLRVLAGATVDSVASALCAAVPGADANAPQRSASDEPRANPFPGLSEVGDSNKVSEELPDLAGLPRSPLEGLIVHIFSEVLAVPKVSVNADFRELGGDTERARVALRKLAALVQVPEDRLHVRDVSTAAICAAKIQGLVGTFPGTNGSELGTRWLVRLGADAESTSQRELPRLFCVPFLGAGGAVFSSMVRRLALRDVATYGVQLPGREQRYLETPFFRFEPLLEAMKHALLPHLRQPYVLFGQSMGALLVFELTRALRREGLPLPARIVLSAMIAPSLVETDPFIQALDHARLLALARGPDGGLADDELMRLTLPTMRADASVLRDYRYVREAPIDVPIVVFGGESDPLVSTHALHAWRDEAGSSCSVRTVAGDHFWLFQAEEECLAPLRQALTLDA